MSSHEPHLENHHLVKLALSGMGEVFWGIALFSGGYNLLALTGSFYMIQVYVLVLTSHRVPTLVALSLLVMTCYIFQGVINVIRTQVRVRAATRFDRKMVDVTHDALIRLPLFSANKTDAFQPMHDIDTLRIFLSDPGIIALFDIPWVPIFLIFVFLPTCVLRLADSLWVSRIGNLNHLD